MRKPGYQEKTANNEDCQALKPDTVCPDPDWETDAMLESKRSDPYAVASATTTRRTRAAAAAAAAAVMFRESVASSAASVCWLVGCLTAL